MKRRPPCTRESRRDGNVLIMVAILIFALLPIASFVIQSGWLTLTRRQMQTGTDVAAVEALRGRDTGDPTSDEQRREDASLVTRALFDEDLLADDDLTDGATPDDPLRFSAGPVINFATTSPPNGPTINNGKFVASKFIDSAGQYDPDLQINIDDDPDGDIVAGTYGRVGTDAMTGDATVDPRQPPAGHDEESDTYDRQDFLAGDSDRAVLARMRRLQPSDESDVPNVRSSGDRLPFLFGRGPFGGPGIAGPGETDFMSYAERGSIVRATSIADSVPAMTVWPRVPDFSIAGNAEFYLDAAAWTDATYDWDTGVTVTVNANGQLQIAGTSVGQVYRDVGTEVVLSIGSALTPYAAGTLDPVGTYVPLVIADASPPSNDVRYVCAFASVTVTDVGTSWTIVRTDSNCYVAPRNASASWLNGDMAALNDTLQDDIRDEFDRLKTDPNYAETLLHVPALRRAY